MLFWPRLVKALLSRLQLVIAGLFVDRNGLYQPGDFAM